MNQSFAYALKRTMPMMAGFLPLGLAYGILMSEAGYNFLWTGFTSVTVLAGSLQFLMLDFFSGGAGPVTVIVTALLLNSRHIFYGLSFLEEFKGYGPWKYFLIYTLADENYSLLLSYEPREGVDDKTVNLLSSGLVAFYWIAFTVLGALVGRLIPFDITGIDFALTALFIVILLDQLRAAKTLLPAGIAVSSSVVSILVFGASNFILPSLAATVTALLVLRPYLEQKTANREGK